MCNHTETGTYYLRARYYDPRLGRFTSEDSEHGNPTDPLSLNLYTYCWDNPLLYIDYTGNGPILSHFVRFVDDVLDFYLRANSLNILNSTNVGASLLMMEADESGIYHARYDCWQAAFGYNNFYDTVFQEFTSAEPQPFDFEYDSKEMRLWGWKGDYINLGAGAELGIYQKMDDIAGVDIDHWVVNKDLSLPMTLTLADTDGNVIINNYSPEDNQWWITGFNPEYTDMIQENLIATFTVDFSGNIDMYNAFQSKNGFNPNCTFDNVNYIVTIRI